MSICEEKIKGSIEFYKLATSLKYTVRQGWIHWNVSKERLESVAEHIYGTCILAVSLHSQLNVDVDIDRVIKMLTLHELEEIIIGDITPFDGVSKEEKKILGKAAVSKILSTLINKKEFEDLIEEFEEGYTKEAEYACLCDNLECNLQAKIYDDEGYMSFENQENNPSLSSKKVQDIISNGAKNVSEVFYRYHRPKYMQNELFIKVLDYVYDDVK
jgi:putative hydrolase of HD superfamily